MEQIIECPLAIHEETNASQRQMIAKMDAHEEEMIAELKSPLRKTRAKVKHIQEKIEAHQWKMYTFLLFKYILMNGISAAGVPCGTRCSNI
jgi:uncharacterized coiled-coil protein SlyX